MMTEEMDESCCPMNTNFVDVVLLVLFCFLQKGIQFVVDHRYFQRGILLAILINTLSMGIEYHNQVRGRPWSVIPMDTRGEVGGRVKGSSSMAFNEWDTLFC